MLISAPPPHLEQGNTNKTTCRISGKIRPPCHAAGQIHLMPFIKQAYQRCSEKCKAQLPPAGKATCYTYCPREEGENKSMGKFIPRAGY